MKSKRTRLVRLIDTYFSKYIRMKYSDNGICTCISCWIEKPYKEMHNAHWISRWCYKYRWDEENCQPACPSCNTYRKEMHMREFTIKQIDRLWRKKIDKMRKEALKKYSPWIKVLENILEEVKIKFKNQEKLLNTK